MVESQTKTVSHLHVLMVFLLLPSKQGVTYDTGGADVKAGGVMAGMHRYVSCERAAIRTCALVCTGSFSYLFGIARTIQDLCIRNIELLVSETCPMSYLG